MQKTASEYSKEYRARRKLEIEALPKRECECGCGTRIAPIDVQNRTVRFARGHQRKNKRFSTDEQKEQVRRDIESRFWKRRRAEVAALPKVQCACGCGTWIAPVTINLKPKRYVRGHQPNSHRGKPAHNRIGNAPLTNKERAKRHLMRKQQSAVEVPCACGCGEMIRAIGASGAPVRYKHGHNPDGLQTRFRPQNPPWNKGLPPYMQVNWRGGRGHLPYGFEFNYPLKRRIRERDGYTCQRCGVTQSELGYTIYIHHLDHDKMNNAPSNLVCSCAKCNSWASRNQDKPFRL